MGLFASIIWFSGVIGLGYFIGNTYPEHKAIIMVMSVIFALVLWALEVSLKSSRGTSSNSDGGGFMSDGCSGDGGGCGGD